MLSKPEFDEVSLLHFPILCPLSIRSWFRWLVFDTTGFDLNILLSFLRR